MSLQGLESRSNGLKRSPGFSPQQTINKERFKMDIQKTYKIDENAASWTITSNGHQYKTSSFCGACDHVHECVLHNIQFEVTNNY